MSETLDYVPGRFKVVRHVRAKLSCRACDTVVARRRRLITRLPEGGPVRKAGPAPVAFSASRS